MDISARSVRQAFRALEQKAKDQEGIRKQVDRYVEGFPLRYDYSNVELPQDGLALGEQL